MYHSLARLSVFCFKTNQEEKFFARKTTIEMSCGARRYFFALLLCWRWCREAFWALGKSRLADDCKYSMTFSMETSRNSLLYDWWIVYWAIYEKIMENWRCLKKLWVIWKVFWMHFSYFLLHKDWELCVNYVDLVLKFFKSIFSDSHAI